MFVVDRYYLKIFQSKTQIKKTTKFVKNRDINNTLHENSKYIEINFYVLRQLTNENEIIVHFKQKVHVVDNFRVNMLLKSNIFDSKKVVIDIKRKFIIFKSCKKLSILIDIIVKKRRIIRVIKNATQLTILTHSFMFISVKIKKKTICRRIATIFFIQKKALKNLIQKKIF